MLLHQSLAKKLPTSSTSSANHHRRRTPHTCTVSGLDRHPPRHHRHRQLPVTCHLTSSFLPVHYHTAASSPYHQHTSPQPSPICNRDTHTSSTRLSSTPLLTPTSAPTRISNQISLNCFRHEQLFDQQHTLPLDRAAPSTAASQSALTSRELCQARRTD